MLEARPKHAVPAGAHNYRIVAQIEGITLHQWGRYHLVFEHDTGETCQDFMNRVLYSRTNASNAGLTRGGYGVEGCFRDDPEAAQTWFDHCVAVKKENR